ncbi:uncharacterized protein B0I36DRAFT_324978 [Microdochium trichocladiopsis]|uniref:Integral membrane protein n=1 Tax=Microdochium trichocladiopsis TaxID=1682393 RepID=A0A9P9BLY1_9PEZI|nr:uncharacterized protein B0I36DRAFT_324978 [Microdochium trichocladiopsis]KAH7029063.1 hypothetical protein B0I36DRAFT_324978 [Microdochium trichocladiopsis]
MVPAPGLQQPRPYTQPYAYAVHTGSTAQQFHAAHQSAPVQTFHTVPSPVLNTTAQTNSHVATQPQSVAPPTHVPLQTPQSLPNPIGTLPREQQPWNQEILRRQEEEAQRPEVQAILKQRQADLEAYLELQRREDQGRVDAQQHMQPVAPVSYAPSPPVTGQQLIYDPATETYTLANQGQGAAYTTAPAHQHGAYQQVVPSQQYQAPHTYMQHQGATPGVFTNTSVINQPVSKEKRPSSTAKWMNKLHDLSAGLANLQLQLMPPGAAATTATPDGQVSSAAQQPSVAVQQPFAPSQQPPITTSVGQPYSSPPPLIATPQQTGNTIPNAYSGPGTAVTMPTTSIARHDPAVVLQSSASQPLNPMASISQPQHALPPSQYHDSPPQWSRQQEQEHRHQQQNLDPESWIRPAPRMSTNSPPNSIIFDCPAPRTLEYEATWYFLPAVPDFLVCTRCHERYISGTIIASRFQSARLSGQEVDGKVNGVRGGGNRCRFNVPRLTRVLIPEVIRKGGQNLGPIEEYMTRRLAMLECPGTNQVKNTAGIKWFSIKSMTTDEGLPLPDIFQYVVVCEACYEEQILGTRFASKLGSRKEPQPEDQTWLCDFGGFPIMTRALLRFSQQDIADEQARGDSFVPSDKHWLDFTNLVGPRWRLPKCEGFRKAVEPTSRKWFRATQLHELVFCEPCYLDKIKLTPFEPHFEQVQDVSHTGLSWMDAALGYTTEEVSLRACQASSRPMIITLNIALGREDLAMLIRVARTILQSPVCTDQGLEDNKLNKITGGQWYRLASTAGGPGGENKFRICEACHACLATSLCLDSYWQSEPPSLAEGQRFVCGLHTGAPRGKEFLTKLNEAIDTGVWARFENHVRVWIDIPPCPRYSHDGTAGRRWFGWEDCLICPECWVLFCEPAISKAVKAGEQGTREQQGTTLGLQGEEKGGRELGLPLHDKVVADARMCCMYSPRMRGMFLAVVQEKLGTASSQSRTVGQSASAHPGTAATISPAINDPTLVSPEGPAEQALLAHARHRHAVYAQTIPQVQMIKQMREMQMMQSLHSGMMGLMYQGSSAIQSIAGNNDGYSYGSSTLGWHDNANGATSAAFFDQSRAQGMGMVAGTAGDMAMARRLLEQWQAVE